MLGMIRFVVWIVVVGVWVRSVGVGCIRCIWSFWSVWVVFVEWLLYCRDRWLKRR